MFSAAPKASQGPAHDIVLTVFMEGTANPIDRITTQIGLFAQLVNAVQLDNTDVKLPEHPGHFKLAFDGCGVSHGIRGTIFATGLQEQCDLVRGYIEGFAAARKTVKINFLGLSRGGIGGLYLAQTLAGFSPDAVLLDMLLFDPVPGNLITMSRYLDWFGFSNTNACMDVTQCRILGRVVVLYPHEPLPDIAVHAPVLARFPEGCRVELDVILGCHQGALWLRPQADTCLAFALIRDFLREAGSVLDIRGSWRQMDVDPEGLLRMLRAELATKAPTDRCAHSSSNRVSIVRHPRGKFLNRAHEALEQQLGGPSSGGVSMGDDPKYMLDFQGSESLS